MTDNQYLDWIANRLRYKHKDSISITDRLKSISSEFAIMPKTLDKKIIENCCKKHFFDFDMDKSEDFKLGYTDTERNDIRKLVTDIYQTILSSENN